MKILLVEDSRCMRIENERALSRAGYKVICAQDGEEALQSARKEHPDLILLDLLLPKMPGVEVLARLKNEPETSSIPVVVVSGLSEKNREKLLAAGAEDYVEKGTLIPDKGIHLLPKLLTDVVYRISRRRGAAFVQGNTSSRP